VLRKTKYSLAFLKAKKVLEASLPLKLYFANFLQNHPVFSGEAQEVLLFFI
jgi:hypothetical protein